jgi:Uncharacterized protein related to plant photosystem II stability/assembly factor
VQLFKQFTLILFCSAIFTSTAISQAGWKLNPLRGSGDLVAVYFTSADNGWIAGDKGYLAVTGDGGRSWNKVPLGTTEDINEIYFRNDKNGYLVAGKKMFMTRDAGQTWQETQIYKSGDFRNTVPEFLSIRFSDKKRGFVIGSLLNRAGQVIDSVVMRTEDGGDTWQRVVVPSKKELFHLDFNGSSHGWIVGDEGLIMATTDGGATWAVQTSGVKRALFNVDFRDDNNGYAVGGGGTILRTEDGGKTWERVTTPYNETFKRIDFADDKNGWIVGHGGSILRSSDRGKTWIKQDSNTREDLYGLYMGKKYGWAVGAKGLIVQYQK